MAILRLSEFNIINDSFLNTFSLLNDSGLLCLIPAEPALLQNCSEPVRIQCPVTDMGNRFRIYHLTLFPHLIVEVRPR